MLIVPVARRDQAIVQHTTAEPTNVPGVVIIPTINKGGGYTGGWSLTHARTGLHLGVGDHPLAYTREAAALLPQDVDWTADRAELANVDGLRVRIHDLNQRVFDTRTDGRPLWWARSSWQAEAPQYLVEVDDLHCEVFDTWAALLKSVDARPISAWPPRVLDEGNVVKRNAPAWSLWCAAPGCTAYLDDAGGDGDGWGACRASRRELVTFAHDEDWTRKDATHWLCPDCTATHPVRTWFVWGGC